MHPAAPCYTHALPLPPLPRLAPPLGLAALVLVALLLAACADRPASETAVASTPTPETAVAFTDITAEAGLDGFRHTTGGFGRRWAPEIVGAGGGFVDFDGDGWLDIVLVRGGALPGRTEGDGPVLALYRNEQDGAFTDVTAEAGLADLRAYGFGITAADVDNDGDADLFLTTLGKNLLLENEGGVFTDVTAEAGLGEEAVWSGSAAFFDADLDGWLDLFVGNYVDWSPEKDLVCLYEGEKVFCTPEEYDGIQSRFYRNNGDAGSSPAQAPTFTDRTAEAGFLGAPGKTFGVVDFDFNRDGAPDLVLANDTQPDQLYVNDGTGRFSDIGTASGIAYDENGVARAGMGIDIGVVDETGEPTVFVGNFSDEMIGVYRHLRNGLFMDRAAVSRIGFPSLKTLTFGLFLFDPDLDGDLDLFAANGHVQTHIEQIQDGITFRQPPQLFMNRGDGTFDAAPAEGVLADPLLARGAAYGDIDRDGDLDVLMTQNGGPAVLWRNDTEGGRHLRVVLEGRTANRDALGTEITAVVDGGRQFRRVRTGSSYLTQHERAVTFGLGDAAQVDSLIVQWPGGATDVFTGVDADQTLRIVEGSGQVEAVPS